jgi:hypothetical protein
MRPIIIPGFAVKLEQAAGPVQFDSFDEAS